MLLHLGHASVLGFWELLTGCCTACWLEHIVATGS
jgi:hypothetical protein